MDDAKIGRIARRYFRAHPVNRDQMIAGAQAQYRSGRRTASVVAIAAILTLVTILAGIVSGRSNGNASSATTQVPPGKARATLYVEALPIDNVERVVVLGGTTLLTHTSGTQIPAHHARADVVYACTSNRNLTQDRCPPGEWRLSAAKRPLELVTNGRPVKQVLAVTGDLPPGPYTLLTPLFESEVNTRDSYIVLSTGEECELNIEKHNVIGDPFNVPWAGDLEAMIEVDLLFKRAPIDPTECATGITVSPRITLLWVAGTVAL